MTILVLLFALSGLGDNMLTALSVARQCSMIPERDRVILLHAHAPEGSNPAYIEWEVAEEYDQNEAVLDVEGVSMI